MSLNVQSLLNLRHGLLPKHEGMCHSGHNDLIYTLASSHSDQPPMGHSDLNVGDPPNP